ncbi:DUF3253 domain-containing protein [Denitrobaculum tricleocarpae]|uniref:DUF3253 domain-containing protein n=1 Tax=Denitrobaculum tricleocarpae TaxID=2591009 RepID=A0A545TF85_9PROT|nr:DUF3253 domain-containing protein [Denitrobaculum tricleocarpae]TQV75878.1 DUF3253 domain-containing protein [Denitrobaculum tricleocarpae]
MTERPEPGEIAEAVLRLCAARGPEKSICPSEVARALIKDLDEWRELMPSVRAVAADLHRCGKISILQGGCEVDPQSAKGPIRLAIPRKR